MFKNCEYFITEVQDAGLEKLRKNREMFVNMLKKGAAGVSRKTAAPERLVGKIAVSFSADRFCKMLLTNKTRFIKMRNQTGDEKEQ